MTVSAKPSVATAGKSALISAARTRDGNDPIFALNGEASRRAANGESILNATLGALMLDDGSLATMASVAETLAGVAATAAAGYAPISGRPDFLQAVIRDVYGDGPMAAQSTAVATPGGTGAIYQAFVNFLEAGQAALTTDFFWGPYSVIAAHSGRRVETFPMFRPDLGFDVDAFAEMLERHIEEQGRALVLLNFPCHNPTGYSLDSAEWHRVASIIRTAGARAPVALLLDCAYMRFAAADAATWVEHIPLMAETATVLVAWTASKSFCQYGARIGALIATHPVEEERVRLASAFGYTCRATWSNCNHQGQIATARLLTDPERRARADAERADLAGLLQKRVTAFNEVAAATAGITFPRYEGGFFAAVFTPDAQRTAAAMRDLGVYVVPLKGAVRVALCSTPAAEISRLVAALAAGVAAAAGAEADVAVQEATRTG